MAVAYRSSVGSISLFVTVAQQGQRSSTTFGYRQVDYSSFLENGTSPRNDLSVVPAMPNVPISGARMNASTAYFKTLDEFG